MKFKALLVSILFTTLTCAMEKPIRAGDLHTLADACNNEGGTVAGRLNSDQKWMNFKAQDCRSLSFVNLCKLKL